MSDFPRLDTKCPGAQGSTVYGVGFRVFLLCLARALLTWTRKVQILRHLRPGHPNNNCWGFRNSGVYTVHKFHNSRLNPKLVEGYIP